jgi:hypothetical protein
MTVDVKWTKAARPGKLLKEIKAANIAALVPQVDADGRATIAYTVAYTPATQELVLTVPSLAVKAALDPIIAAHDPTTPAPEETALSAQAAQDTTATTDLRNQYQKMITRLEEIQTQMVGNPAAATTRDAVRDLAIGLERALKVLAAVARGQ